MSILGYGIAAGLLFVKGTAMIPEQWFGWVLIAIGGGLGFYGANLERELRANYERTKKFEDQYVQQRDK